MYSSNSSNFIIVSRDDFVGQFQGHTTQKTNELLRSNSKKVIFVDEAYSLCHDEKDSFGLEALSTLNLFMSQNPKTRFIFAGYKHLMEAGIFFHQPGLQRRCMWVLENSDYTPDHLFSIFKFQMEDWTFDDSIDKSFFQKSDFPGFGGDTQKLIFYSKLEQAMENFVNKETNRHLTVDHVKSGIEILRKNQSVKQDIHHLSMFQ